MPNPETIEKDIEFIDEKDRFDVTAFTMEACAKGLGLKPVTEAKPVEKLFKAKYIILSFNGVEAAFTFPAFIGHADVYAGLTKQLHATDWQVEAISAGFCCEVCGEIQVDGMSTSLGLSSRPEDAAILAQLWR
jgi:hypothetical protein